MLYRRKLLLNLLRYAGRDLSLVQIHKLMFLVSQRITSSSYEFIPRQYGCYSLVLHSDVHAMAGDGLLTYRKGDGPFQTTVGYVPGRLTEKEIALRKEDQPGVAGVLRTAPLHDVNELLLLTYRTKPFYAINSELLPRFRDDVKLMEDVASIKTRIDTYRRGLFTIGYQECTLDGFIRSLMLRNVKYLVDVRKNAFSMRREFCGGALEKSLAEAGITYIPLPQVGIPSKNRKEMIPAGKTKELFAWYASDVLPGCLSYANQVASLVGGHNTALMCYEARPEDCHRSLFANFCLSVHPEIGQIIHIRNRSTNEKESPCNSLNLSLSFS